MRQNKVQRIDAVLKEFLRVNNLEEQYRDYLIVKEWDNCVGEKVAAMTINKYFKGGTLYCTIGSSMLRSQLGFQKEIIITKINKALGEDTVKEIRLL